MTITNDSAVPDVLEAVSSPQYDKVEMHTHEKAGNIMRMFRVEQIGIPARGAATLAPGGLHLMLFGAKSPLKTGDSVTFNLRFRNGGTISTVAKIRSPSAAAEQPGAEAHPEHHH